MDTIRILRYEVDDGSEIRERVSNFLGEATLAHVSAHRLISDDERDSDQTDEHLEIDLDVANVSPIPEGHRALCFTKDGRLVSMIIPSLETEHPTLSLIGK